MSRMVPGPRVRPKWHADLELGSFSATVGASGRETIDLDPLSLYWQTETDAPDTPAIEFDTSGAADRETPRIVYQGANGDQIGAAWLYIAGP